MGFGINGHDLPFIGSYNKAKQLHDNITPIRGKEVRPLGDRRKHHQQIRVTMRNGNGAAGIACVLYSTECVTYYEDGTVHLNHGGYISQSTCKFIERIAPVSRVRMDKQRDCLVVRVAHGDYQCGSDGLWLRYNPQTNLYHPFDYESFAVHTVDRKAMKQVRQQYAAFMAYVVGLGKLTEWAKPEMAAAATLRGRGDTVLDAARGDDMDEWAWAVKYVLYHAGVLRHAYDYSTNRWVDVWRCDQKRVENYMTHCIKNEHAREVLIREPLPTGVHKKDPNSKYARYMREV